MTRKFGPIGLRFWKHEIDMWAIEKRYPILDWPEVCRREGGFRETRYRTIDEAKAHPDTYPGQWFQSGQADFSIYNLPEYVYSLLFGALNVSAQVYTLAGKRLAETPGSQIIDVGGTAFTAVRMLNHGASKVFVSNYDDSPQIEFVKWFARNHRELDIEIAPHDDLPMGIDMIASEYLEHFQNPEVEFDRLLQFNPPRVFNKSAFCTIAYGHFIPITIDGAVCKTIGQANAAFRKHIESKGINVETVRMFNAKCEIYT